MFMSKLVEFVDQTPPDIEYGWCQFILQVDWQPAFQKKEQHVTADSESWTERGSLKGPGSTEDVTNFGEYQYCIWTSPG